MKSDVFDSFVKIAQEKGMISNDSEDSRKKLEKNPRADSLDISAIEALYGVSPNKPKDMEYEHNIMEDAHPNSVVISPSYDALNGLVENEIERQNINIHIVMKTPDGLSTKRKYAQDLVLSLVRIAQDLDNKNNAQLMSLADICLLQASEPLTKKALAPLAIGAIVAAVAVLGGIYWKNHTDFNRDGFEQDFQKLIAELQDLVEANESMQTALSAGYTYRPEFIQEMTSFKTKLEQYHSLYQSVVRYIDSLEKPRTAEELLEEMKKPENQSAIQAYKTFVSVSNNLLPYLQKIVTDFNSPDYKSRQIMEKGVGMKLVDTFLHGGKGLVADDFEDVAHALGPFMKDMTELAGSLKKAQDKEKAMTDELKQAAFKSEEMFGGEGGETKSPSNTFVSAPGRSKEEIDQGAESLDKQLGELGLV